MLVVISSPFFFLYRGSLAVLFCWLGSEAATAYVEVRAFQARVRYAQDNVRTQRGSLQLTIDRVDLATEVAKVAETARIPLQKIPDAGQFMSLGDERRVRQIVRNLLTNAQRYGGSTIAVEVFRDRRRGELADPSRRSRPCRAGSSFEATSQPARPALVVQ